MLISQGPGSVDSDQETRQAIQNSLQSLQQESGRRNSLVISSSDLACNIKSKVMYSPPPRRKTVQDNELSSGSIDQDEYSQIQLAIELSIQEEERRQSGCAITPTDSEAELQKAIEMSIQENRQNCFHKDDRATNQENYAELMTSKEEQEIIERRIRKGKSRAA